MSRGDKSGYSDKQKRQAEHIRQAYGKRGLSQDESEARAWATVNKLTHGGKKSGSGRGKITIQSLARAGNHVSGRALTKHTSITRSNFPKKATPQRRKET